jgi:SAM-dependent methyltransferase
MNQTYMQRVGERLQRHPHLYRASEQARTLAWLARRGRQIHHYLEAHETRYLRMGAGKHTDPDWLAVDYNPVLWNVAYVDARHKLPLPAMSFDAIVCEHMIEHINYQDGRHMIGEFFRVLRKGGVVRIATPDLDFVRRLLTDGPISDELMAYVRWSNANLGEAIEKLDPDNVTLTVNRLMNYGGDHKFVYDADTLVQALQEAGFKNAAKVSPGFSRYSAMQDVDRHNEEVPQQFNELETLVVEAEV